MMAPLGCVAAQAITLGMLYYYTRENYAINGLEFAYLAAICTTGKVLERLFSSIRLCGSVYFVCL